MEQRDVREEIYNIPNKQSDHRENYYFNTLLFNNSCLHSDLLSDFNNFSQMYYFSFIVNGTKHTMELFHYIYETI